MIHHFIAIICKFKIKKNTGCPFENNRVDFTSSQTGNEMLYNINLKSSSSYNCCENFKSIPFLYL